MGPIVPASCVIERESCLSWLRRRFAAFTLIEVLVSTTIIAVVVVMLSQMLNNVSGIWRMGHAQVEKSEGGRAILESISRELQASQLPVDRADHASLQLVVNPSGVSEIYKNPAAIFWQAPLATDQSHEATDLAEIGYFVQWDDTTTPNNPRARLCRFFVNSTTTVTGTTCPNPYYLIYSKPDDWVNDVVIRAVAPADKNNNYQGLFIENVVGLWVTCVDSSGNETTAFDSRSAVPTGNCTLPSAIDLSFVLLDNNSANRITGTLEGAIKALAGSSKDAATFVKSAQANKAFNPILSGLRPCKTRIYLQNSK